MQEIEQGIKPVQELLNKIAGDTFSSCEGHFPSINHPWRDDVARVQFHVKPQFGNEMYGLMQKLLTATNAYPGQLEMINRYYTNPSDEFRYLYEDWELTVLPLNPGQSDYISKEKREITDEVLGVVEKALNEYYEERIDPETGNVDKNGIASPMAILPKNLRKTGLRKTKNALKEFSFINSYSGQPAAFPSNDSDMKDNNVTIDFCATASEYDPLITNMVHTIQLWAGEYIDKSDLNHNIARVDTSKRFFMARNEFPFLYYHWRIEIIPGHHSDDELKPAEKRKISGKLLDIINTAINYTVGKLSPGKQD